MIKASGIIKRSCSVFAVAITSFLVWSNPHPALSAECAGKSVAACADYLAEKVDALVKEHDALRLELKNAKDELSKQIAAVRRVEMGTSAVAHDTMSVNIKFPPGAFTKAPKVAIAVRSFFGGFQGGNYPSMNLTIQGLDEHGFNVVMSAGTADAQAFEWIAVQQ